MIKAVIWFLNGAAVDKDELKARVDLRQLVAEIWGPGHPGGKVVMYQARWRDDDRQPSFAVYANGYKDFGGSGDAGDVYDWIQREYGMDFSDALHWLQNRAGTPDTALIFPAHRNATSSHEPPPTEWQRAARHLLDQAQTYLWSDAGDARRVRAYLHSERGLTPETARRFGLGYNPGWARSGYCYWSESAARWRRARLVPGIVIPWYRESILVALRVRCRVGRLAQWLNVTPDAVRGNPLDKYRCFYGSKLSGTLFNGDALRPHGDVLIAEGEFDTMLAAQTLGDPMSVVTLGSATNRLTRRLRDQLAGHPRIYSVLDRDATGHAATERLARVLGERHHPLALPDGHDITDYVVEQGGDFARWVAEVTRNS